MLHVPAPRLEDSDDGPLLWDFSFDQWGTLDPAKLEPRRWIYGRHYLQGAVSATIADGGVGKSTLALTEAIAMVTGRPLLGIEPWKEFFEDGGERLCLDRREVLYYNAEEPLRELQRRVLAICQHHEIDPKELNCSTRRGDKPWRAPASLTILSGHDYPLVVGRPDEHGGIVFSDNLEFLDGYEGDVIILDAFVSIHQCPENDNSMIDAIVKRLARSASTQPIKSIELIHHSRKPAQGGNMEIGAADARGASALADGVRSLRTLNRMTESEAIRAKVEDHRSYFRADFGKTNYAAPSSGSHWYRHHSVVLPNNDEVGIVVPWKMPGAFDGVTTAHMHQVRELARGGEYRADPRSPDWVGNAVAEVLDLDAESEADRKRIKVILKTWYEKGALKKVERRGSGDDRHLFLFVEPGEWSEP